MKYKPQKAAKIMSVHFRPAKRHSSMVRLEIPIPTRKVSNQSLQKMRKEDLKNQQIIETASKHHKAIRNTKDNNFKNLISKVRKMKPAERVQNANFMRRTALLESLVN